jgi:hypothetical protein
VFFSLKNSFKTSLISVTVKLAFSNFCFIGFVAVQSNIYQNVEMRLNNEIFPAATLENSCHQSCLISKSVSSCLVLPLGKT